MLPSLVIPWGSVGSSCLGLFRGGLLGLVVQVAFLGGVGLWSAVLRGICQRADGFKLGVGLVSWWLPRGAIHTGVEGLHWYFWGGVCVLKCMVAYWFMLLMLGVSC